MKTRFEHPIEKVYVSLYCIYSPPSQPKMGPGAKLLQQSTHLKLEHHNFFQLHFTQFLKNIQKIYDVFRFV